jgi:hypothetical protein
MTARDQVLQMFNLGLMSLEFRGLAERLYWATCAKIRDYCRKLDEMPEELEGLESILSDIYFCNMSRCSSRCPTAGRSTSCSRSCRSTGSTSADAQGRARRHHLRLRRQDRPLRQPSRRQAHARGARPRAPATSTTSPRSSSARTRRRSATCTTCSATRTSCTSASRTTAAGGSRRSSWATPRTRCSSTWSTTSRSSTRRCARLRARDPRGRG